MSEEGISDFATANSVYDLYQNPEGISNVRSGATNIRIRDHYYISNLSSYELFIHYRDYGSGIKSEG
jgi:hypothetical protein